MRRRLLAELDELVTQLAPGSLGRSLDSSAAHCEVGTDVGRDVPLYLRVGDRIRSPDRNELLGLLICFVLSPLTGAYLARLFFFPSS